MKISSSNLSKRAISSILEQPSTRLPGNKRLEKRKVREKSEKITISKELYIKIESLT